MMHQKDKYFEGLFTESTPTYRGMSYHILDSLYTGNEVFPNTDFDFLQSPHNRFTISSMRLLMVILLKKMML